MEESITGIQLKELDIQGISKIKVRHMNIIAIRHTNLYIYIKIKCNFFINTDKERKIIIMIIVLNKSIIERQLKIITLMQIEMSMKIMGNFKKQQKYVEFVHWEKNFQYFI